MFEVDFEPVSLEEAAEIALRQIENSRELTQEEIIAIVKKFRGFMSNNPCFSDIEKHIYKYWKDNTKWMMYVLFQELLYEYSDNYTYQELLDLWMDLYVMDIYPEDAVDDLEYLWQLEDVDDWDETKVTIYRGVNVQSLEVDRALSWTTDKNIAYWFACRSNQECPKVITGEIEKGAIIKQYNGRQEKEVVVLPAHVSIIQEDDVIYSKEEISRISNKMKNKHK